MAFPTVAGSQTSQQTTNSTTSNVTLPGSIASGDLIIAFIAADSGAGAMTWPSPWVEIKDEAGTGFQFSVGYLIATGGETTVAVTHTTERSNHIAIRITGWHGTTAPEISTAVTGSSTTPNPPSFDPSGWGTEDTLWIAVVGADDSATPFPITVWPYANNQISNSTATSAADVAICTTNSATGSVDPGTFTMTVTETWNAYTMAVRPAAGTTARGHAQTQADIKQTYTDKSGQPQADIKAVSWGLGQSQADIKQTYTDKNGQSQADIKQIGRGVGQSQADIKATSNAFAQSQADIKATNRGFGQSNADIKQTYRDKSGQSNADILQQGRGFGQSQATIRGNAFGQAQSDIKATDRGFGQAQGKLPSAVITYPLCTGDANGGAVLGQMTLGDTALGSLPQAGCIGPFAQARAHIKNTYFGSGQSQASIKAVSTPSGQAQAKIKSAVYVSGQAQADIKQTYPLCIGFSGGAVLGNLYIGETQLGSTPVAASCEGAFGQAQAKMLGPITYGTGQAQADIKQTYFGLGQSQAEVKHTYYVHGQCQATIRGNAYGQAQGDIKQTYFGLAQAQAEIKQIYFVCGQAQADIKQTYFGLGQSQADIKAVGYGLSQCQADIKAVGRGFGQAQGLLGAIYQGYGQAQADIKATEQSYGQCQAEIKQVYYGLGQSQSWIKNTYFGLGQCQADIKAIGYGLGQCQSEIKATVFKHGQCQAYISSGGFAHGQAQGYIPSTYYLVDTFTRETDYGVVGSPDIGPTWTYPFITQDIEQVHVNGSALEHHIGDNNFNYLWLKSPLSVNDIDVTGEIRIESYESPLYPYIQIEVGGGLTWVEYLNGDGSWSLHTSAGSSSFEVYTLTSNVTHAFRLQLAGGTLKFKAWPAGQSEPIPWLLTQGSASVANGPLIIYSDEGFDRPSRILWDNITVQPFSSNVTQKKVAQAQAFIIAPLRHGQAAGAINSAIKQPKGQAQATVLPQNALVKESFSRVIYLTDGPTGDQLGVPDAGRIYYYSSFDYGMISRGNYLEMPEVYRQREANFQSVVSINSFTAFIDFYSEFYDSNSFIEIYGSDQNTTESIDLYINAGVLEIDTQADFDFVSFTPTVGVWYRLMVLVDGTTVKGKIWNLANSEPDWMVEATKTATITNLIYFGVGVGEVDVHTRKFRVDNVGIYSSESFINLFQGQARAVIAKGLAWGQAQAKIKAFDVNKHGQSQGFIRKQAGYGQALALIVTFKKIHGQAQATIDTGGLKSGQAQAQITTTTPNGDAQAWILNTFRYVGQAQAHIIEHWRKLAQAQADIHVLALPVAQAQAQIHRSQGYGQAQAFLTPKKGTGQAQGDIKSVYYSSGQAQGYVGNRQGYAQAQGYIKRANSRAFGQAQAYVLDRRAHGNAMAEIRRPQGNGQAQALMRGTVANVYGQASARIFYIYQIYGLALAMISKGQGAGQAQAKVKAFGQTVLGNAQSSILAKVVTYGHGQAMAYIKGPASGQATALILGAKYLVRFNGYDLPGYAQQESIDSVMRIEDHYAPFQDGSLPEYVGLQNKLISIRMKAVASDYIGVKTQVQTAATMVRSTTQYRKLYIQNTDKYWEAMGQKISTEKAVRESMRALDYTVEFEARPWLMSDKVYTISGTGIINTDQVSRTMYDGGWTPAKLTLTGTDITVSGYTATGDFTGFITVSGAVTNLVIDSNAYTAEINSINVNNLLHSPDYIIYVGPGKTFFAIVGASSCNIEYQNRWYL